MKITAKHRLYAYSVIAGGLGILAFYGLIGPEEVPIWLGFAGIVLGVAGNATAAYNLKHQIEDGAVE
ncbi:MAG: hypothetical protein WDA07_08250 [Leucobacter sp.]